jgi:CRP-like cAMP-binding protein
MFGELAQMSGEPRSATVQAVTSCELVVIEKQAFSQILQENPSFAELISQRMAERQAALEAVGKQVSSEERSSSVSMHKGRLLARVREFFGLV